jgi:electron transfer flavoprotein beta subunit
MHIAVCVKHIPDPEAAFSQFRIDEEARQVVPAAGLPWVMSPFDEQALEAALRLREGHPGARITVLTLGAEAARNALKHGLAMGADDGVLLSDPAFEGGDGYATARALAAAVARLATVELVLAGRQAADWDAGVVGAGVAELLGWPLVSFAKDVRVESGTLRVERVLDDGDETIEAPLPAVVTVSNELGAARKPSLRETMRAARKPVATWGLSDLGLQPSAVGSAAARCVRERVFVPVKVSRCEMMEGATPEEQARQLAQRLREARVI